MSAKVISVTGIDTDIGKSIVTGLLARYLQGKGKSVITQKICQTGCKGISEDIRTHRKIMGIELQEVDHLGVTCPYVFAEPCSPHLAAKLAGKRIDCSKISAATVKLAREFNYILLEGVGGLQVPLTLDYTLLDYLAEKKYPLILVSSCRLGSINHTLSALELLRYRRLEVLGIVYNSYFEVNLNIAADSSKVFSHYLKKNGFTDNVISLPTYDDGQQCNTVDFAEFF